MSLIVILAKHPSPELTAIFPSKLLFSWFTSLVRKGWKSPLMADDIFDLNPENKCSNIKKMWKINWEAQRSRKLKEIIKTKNQETADLRMSILPTIYRTYGKFYVTASSLRLIRTLLNVVGTIY